MSEPLIDEISSSLNGLITETDHTVKETGVQNEDEETWLYRNNKSKHDENLDHTIAPSIDEITTQEIHMREKTTTSLVGNQFDDDDDDDDDDDGIQVTIGNYEPETSTFQTNRQKNRAMLNTNPMMPPKPSTIRGVDFDVQGIINGQPTYEHDMNAYKDEEKPWKKPGADITDYFNYGFTEETWAQYCDRQRRLRAENNLARLNVPHIPPMPPIMQGHPAMVHPMNPHPMNPHSMMMINKPINMPIMARPMNIRRPDGKIGVIGTTDQTSRRPVFEAPNNFEPPPFMNGPPFPGGQPSNGQTVGDLISTPPPTTNGHPSSHGTPPSGTHPIQTLGAHRLPMMSLPPGMQFRPQFGHPHAVGGPQFFPHGSVVAGMHGDRPPQPYFVPHRPQQPWDSTGVPPVHGFPPGSFPPQTTASTTTGNTTRVPSSRSPTPENRSSRSSTPEENRPNANASASASGENEKSLKDDRYKERYRDDRDHHSSSRRQLSSKDRSSSSSYRPHHRSSEHEYERPRNDRNSSRDRDDKYERYSRKRHHKDDSNRHHRGDDELSRSHRSSHRSPSKTNPTESSQTLNEQPEVVSELDQPTSSSPSVNRSSYHGGDSERSSSRHSHHKKSSKRSRHDSGDERSSNHHHRRSKDKSSSSNKKSTNQTESLSDVKEQINE